MYGPDDYDFDPAFFDYTERSEYMDETPADILSREMEEDDYDVE